jgi:hypothetical protein
VNKKVLYDLLFRASAETLLEVANPAPPVAVKLTIVEPMMSRD